MKLSSLFLINLNFVSHLMIMPIDVENENQSRPNFSSFKNFHFFSVDSSLIEFGTETLSLHFYFLTPFLRQKNFSI